MGFLSDQQWNIYEEQGFLRLGHVVTDNELAALQARMDEIMMGTASLDYDRMMFQLDSETGRYTDIPPQTVGHKGATLNYRKIQGLELDPIFLVHMQRPLFREICARVYGKEEAISIYRAMFMNKPAGRGTVLPWHQDYWGEIDRLAQVTIWTALDDSTVPNGCIRVLPGSHKLGVIENKAFITAQRYRELEQEYKPTFLEFKAGESVVLNNLLLHTSGLNKTDQPRRAFSSGYLYGNTRRRKDGQAFPLVFGEGSLVPATE